MEREYRFLLKRVLQLHIQRTARSVLLLCLAVAGVIVIPVAHATEAETSGFGMIPEQAIALVLEGEVGDNDIRDSVLNLNNCISKYAQGLGICRTAEGDRRAR